MGILDEIAEEESAATTPPQREKRGILDEIAEEEAAALGVLPSIEPSATRGSGDLAKSAARAAALAFPPLAPVAAAAIGYEDFIRPAYEIGGSAAKSLTEDRPPPKPVPGQGKKDLERGAKELGGFVSESLLEPSPAGKALLDGRFAEAAKRLPGEAISAMNPAKGLTAPAKSLALEAARTYLLGHPDDEDARAVWEWATGEPWRSQAEIQRLARTDPGAAREVQNAQKGQLSATRHELLGLKRSLAALAPMVIEGTSNIFRRAAAENRRGGDVGDRLVEAMSGPVDAFAGLGGEMMRSTARTAEAIREGRPRAGAPVAAALDVLGAGQIGSGARAAGRVAKSGGSLREANKAFRTGVDQQAASARAAADALAESNPLTSGNMRFEGFRAQRVDPTLADELKYHKREAGPVFEARAEEILESLKKYSPEERAALSLTHEAGVADRLEGRQLLEAEAELRSIIDSEKALEQTQYAPIREALEEAGGADELKAALRQDAGLTRQLAESLTGRSQRQARRADQLADKAEAAAKTRDASASRLERSERLVESAEARALDRAERVEDAQAAARRRVVAQAEREVRKADARALRMSKHRERMEARRRGVKQEKAQQEQIRRLEKERDLGKTREQVRAEEQARALEAVDANIRELEKATKEALGSLSAQGRKRIFIESARDLMEVDDFSGPRAWLAQRGAPGKYPKLHHMGGELDAIKSLTDGSRRLVLTPEDAFVQITRGAKGIEDLEYAAERIRSIPGYERFSLYTDDVPEFALLKQAREYREKDIADLVDEAVPRRIEQQAVREPEIAADMQEVGSRGPRADPELEALGVHPAWTDAAAREELARLKKPPMPIREKGWRARDREQKALRDEAAAEKRADRAAARADDLAERVDEIDTPASKREVRAARAEGRAQGEAKRRKADAKKAERDLERDERRADKAAAKADEAKPRLKDSAAYRRSRSEQREALFRHAPEELREKLPALELDGELVATAEGTLRLRGKDVDVVKLAAQGRLKFTGPDKALADLANEALLPVIAQHLSLTREKLKYGLIAEDTADLGAFNYQRIFYDPKRTREHALKLYEQNVAKARERALTEAASGDGSGALDRYHRAVEQAIADLKTTEGVKVPNVGVRKAVSLDSLKQAHRKYVETTLEQVTKGRTKPEDFHITAAAQLMESARQVSEYQLFDRVSQIDQLFATFDPKRPPGKVRFAKVAWGGNRVKVPVVTHDGRQWVQVPDTVVAGTKAKRWGALSGRWMTRTDFAHLAETAQFMGEHYARLLSVWKTNKVVNNVASHTNVLAGNLVNQSLIEGITVRQATKDLRRAYRDLAKRGAEGAKRDPVVEAFVRDGGQNTSFLVDELDILSRSDVRGGGALAAIYDEAKAARQLGTSGTRALAEAIADRGWGSTAIAGMEWVTDAIFGLGGRTRKLFDAHESASRLALYRRSLERQAKKAGKPLGTVLKDRDARRAAVQHYLDIQLDYSDLPAWAKAARQLPLFGVPFISYQVKATGLFTRWVASNPGKTRALIELNENAYDLAHFDEQKRRDQLPSYLRASAVMVGDQVLDVRTLSPVEFFPITTLESKGGEQRGIADPAPLFDLFGGPGRFIVDLAMNKDSFTGRPIYNEDMSEGDIAKMIGWEIAKEFAPSTWTYGRENVKKAEGKGQREKKRRTLAQAVARVFGLKLSEPDIERTMFWAAKTYEEKMRAHRSAMRKELRDLPGDATPEQRQAVQARFRARMARARTRFMREKGPKFQ